MAPDVFTCSLAKWRCAKPQVWLHRFLSFIVFPSTVGFSALGVLGYALGFRNPCSRSQAWGASCHFIGCQVVVFLLLAVLVVSKLQFQQVYQVGLGGGSLKESGGHQVWG